MSKLELFRVKVRKTVGYNESDNKKEFLKGADVAYSILSDFYNEEIKRMNTLNESLSKQYVDVYNDMENLIRILKKYSND